MINRLSNLKHDDTKSDHQHDSGLFIRDHDHEYKDGEMAFEVFERQEANYWQAEESLP